MNLKDLRRLTKEISVKRKLEEEKKDSEKKEEYIGISQELIEKKKTLFEEFSKAHEKGLFEKILPYLKLALLILILILLAFQFALSIKEQRKKAKFKNYVPQCVTPEKRDCDLVERFVDRFIKIYIAGGENAVKSMWNKTLPEYVVKVSIDKLKDVKDIRGLILRKAILNKSANVFTVIYQDDKKQCLIFKVLKDVNNTYNLVGID